MIHRFAISGVMNITALEAKIQKLKLAHEKLVAKAEAAAKKKLLKLPLQVGLATIAELIEALEEVAGKGQRGRKPKPVGAGTRKGRAVITDATRAEVKKLAQSGKTGTEIAKALDISLPSVQNIKKALGLVKARK